MTDGEEADKKAELAGGLKNALERGENLEKAKQSFLNAGYKEEEVEAAARELPQTSPEAMPSPSQPGLAPKPTSAAPVSVPQAPTPGQKLPVPGKAIPPITEKKMSKNLMIILGVVVVLILVTAGLLGLFWDKIF